jgi:hypothetical protein
VHWIRRSGLVDPTAPPPTDEGDESKKAPEKDIEKGEPRKEPVAESSSKGATPSSFSPRVSSASIVEEVPVVEEDICDNGITDLENSNYDGVKQFAKTRSGNAIDVGEGKTVRFKEDITHENVAVDSEGTAREYGAAEKSSTRVQITEAQ